MDVRDLTIEKVTVKNFRYGLDFDWHDTYIIKIKGVELSNNYWNVSSRLPAKANAGENIVISDALLSESASHCVYWNAPGIKMVIEKSSLDYNSGTMLFLANGARGNAFKYAQCHIEGFGGMLVHQEAQAVAWFGKPNRVIFDEHSEIIAAGNTPGVWSPRRKILHSGAVLDKLGSMVEIRCPIVWPSPPSEPHIALMGYTDPTPQYMQAIYVCPMSPEPDCLVSYDQSANKGLYRFSGAEGESVKNSVDNATGYTFSTNGNPTIVYGQIDSDFLQHVIINFSAETEWVELRNKGLFYVLEANAEINTGISVMMEALQSGTLTLNTRFNHFHGADKVIAGYEDGPVFNVSELIGAVYNGIISPLTTSKYVGVQSAMRFTRRDLGFPTRAEYIQPGIVLRGAKGQVRIKLPVIWPTRGRGSCTVIS
ncbi:hypothetical protein [Klebsiella electrica]|uniref:Uncharacterized protein n=1 Tax=Klebsiella electrica TaxID=1259973 RepID=A0AAJ5QXH7_9ENTR|nr:hypothetical protein [Klebsiella electrica]WBW63691.1 hypothetical protein OR613_12755 [Klebsiella electrica]